MAIIVTDTEGRVTDWNVGAEREVVLLSESADVNPVALAYLNRLSDFLFVAARHANDRGARDAHAPCDGPARTRPRPRR